MTNIDRQTIDRINSLNGINGLDDIATASDIDLNNAEAILGDIATKARVFGASIAVRQAVSYLSSAVTAEIERRAAIVAPEVDWLAVLSAALND